MNQMFFDDEELTLMDWILMTDLETSQKNEEGFEDVEEEGVDVESKDGSGATRRQ